MLFLLDPNKFSSDPDAVIQNVNGILTNQGAEIKFTRPWNESKLAFPIKNFKKGTYLLTYFTCDSRAIPTIEHDCKLNEIVLRHLVIKLDPKIAEQVLMHLSGNGEPPARPARESAEPGSRGRG
jgi:small subunit ribosomal protein S6